MSPHELTNGRWVHPMRDGIEISIEHIDNPPATVPVRVRRSNRRTRATGLSRKLTRRMMRSS